MTGKLPQLLLTALRKFDKPLPRSLPLRQGKGGCVGEGSSNRLNSRCSDK